MMNQPHSSMDWLPALVEDSEQHFRCRIMLTVSSLGSSSKVHEAGMHFQMIWTLGIVGYWGWEARRVGSVSE